MSEAETLAVLEIGDVTIVTAWTPDYDSDVSWLGDFSRNPGDSWYIDRYRGWLLGDPIPEPEFPEDPDCDPDDCPELWTKYTALEKEYGQLLSEWEDQHGLELVDSTIGKKCYDPYRESRYWIPGPNHVPPGDPKHWEGHGIIYADTGAVSGQYTEDKINKEEDIRYILQDWKRMEDLNDGDWQMMVISVEVKVRGHTLGEAYVGSVESDFGVDYLKGDIIPDLLGQAWREARKAVMDITQAFDTFIYETSWEGGSLNLDSLTEQLINKLPVK